MTWSRGSRRALLPVVAVLATGVVTGCGEAPTSGTTEPAPQIVVPMLGGLPASLAAEVVTKVGLRPQFPAFASALAIESQSPPAGASVPAGTSVTVTPNAGIIPVAPALYVLNETDRTITFDSLPALPPLGPWGHLVFVLNNACNAMPLVARDADRRVVASYRGDRPCSDGTVWRIH